MTEVGGLRARLLHDSIQLLIENGLTTLGWFDPDRTHKPINFLATPAEWDQPIEFNSMVVTTRSRTVEFPEVGSNLTQDTVTMGVDIYTESESLAVDLANDVRDVLRGRLTTNALGGTMPILDLRMATPAPIGHALIMDVRATRIPAQVGAAHTRHWHGVDATVLDHYYTSEGP